MFALHRLVEILLRDFNNFQCLSCQSFQLPNALSRDIQNPAHLVRGRILAIVDDCVLASNSTGRTPV